VKKAIIIVPSCNPSDSRCCDTLRSALEYSGYEVAVAPSILAPQSDAHSFLEGIQDSDLVVCDVTGREAHVFYYLGFAHALGRRVLVLSQTPNDIPFHEAPSESLLYNPLEQHWDETLLLNVTRAVKVPEAAQPAFRGQPVERSKKRPFIRWALSNEIKFNLSELERVRAKDLVFLGVWHSVDRGSVHIALCETDAFESEDVQRAQEGLSENALGSLKAVYQGFDKINQKAKIADQEVSLRTAQEYLQAVREFENNLMDTALELIEQLVAKGL
jgi:hypothetical protein